MCDCQKCLNEVETEQQLVEIAVRRNSRTTIPIPPMRSIDIVREDKEGAEPWPRP